MGRSWDGRLEDEEVKKNMSKYQPTCRESECMSAKETESNRLNCELNLSSLGNVKIVY